MTRLNPLMRVVDHFIEELKAHRPGIKKRRGARRSPGTSLVAVGIPAPGCATTRTSSRAACGSGS